MLASPLFLQEREASADRPRVCHSHRENSVSSSSRFRAIAGRPAAVVSHKGKSSQESHSDRDFIPLAHRAVQRENESRSRLSESENDTRSILEEQRHHLLSEPRSEVLKQEYRADFLDCSIRENFKDKFIPVVWRLTKLTLDMKHLEESRPSFTKNWRSEREHSENDDFSRQELRESQATIHDLTSQIQELQERVNVMNDSREFQDVHSVCSGKLSHVPCQPAVVPSLRGMLSRDQSLRPDTWNMYGTSGNVFDSPLAPINSSSTPYREGLHSWKLEATDGDPVRPSTGRDL